MDDKLKKRISHKQLRSVDTHATTFHSYFYPYKTHAQKRVTSADIFI